VPFFLLCLFQPRKEEKKKNSVCFRLPYSHEGKQPAFGQRLEGTNNKIIK
jgi:hypothetical protein